MELRVKLDEGAIRPTRAHSVDAGLDLYALCNTLVRNGQKELISTGVHVEIPKGYFGQVSLRSGFASRNPVMLANGVGIIDTGYTGEIKICLQNLSLYDDVKINRGDKIAQLVIIPCSLPELVISDGLSKSDRGSRGFGSTGR